MPRATLLTGDCRDLLLGLETESVHSIVTDPPYGLEFMGRSWDADVPVADVWAECLRVLKPGGHLLAFGGTRTYHRLVCAIEDAGFEIRDQIGWAYGSGFPKNHNVSKGIDKMLGAEREVLGVVDPRSSFDGRDRSSAAINTNWRKAEGRSDTRDLSKRVITAPATEAATEWDGWGTALKPAWEPIVVARKPLSEKSVAANVLEHGTGALNIDDCRVPLNGDYKSRANGRPSQTGLGDNYDPATANQPDTAGRWPANLIHDGSDEVLALFPDSNGSGSARTLRRGTRDDSGWGMQDEPGRLRDAGTGSAARFFYCAKANKKDRGEGNDHPTVKPTELMRYLCRLVTPPSGIVLDPFMGSGSTGRAALLEGFCFVGIELNDHYTQIAARRIDEVRRAAA